MKQKTFTDERLRYLELLSKQFPSIRDASTEIINLQAILNLPKGTEHFLSDIHGEYESFFHVTKNASGVIKRYIDELFSNTMTESEMKNLATLVYYPHEKLSMTAKEGKNTKDWYRVIIFRLIKLCKRASFKYTRSKVRKAMDPSYAYIIEELTYADESNKNKQDYYNQIINSIISIGRVDDYITEICKVIQRLAIDRLHIIGDIFDRGPDADKVMDVLMNHHSIDIEWGNHDIVWMGAAAGGEACILNAIRISARYANLNTIEDGYGINLVPLASYAIEQYSDCSCEKFMPKGLDADGIGEKQANLMAKIHKAASILQFKVEGNTIKRNPEFFMEDRLLLDKIDFEKKTIKIGDKEYPMLDCDFPTVDPKDPYALTEEEQDIMDKLVVSFQTSMRLQEHARLLFAKGGMYRIYNGNLLFHGCVPLNQDGTLKDVKVGDEYYRGIELFDAIDAKVREGYLNHSDKESMIRGQDMLWYLWCGADSPLFGKDKMTTFERYFIEDKATHKEAKDTYYKLIEQVETCERILENFGLNKDKSHIINGHVPVKVSKGESPIKAGGKLIVIDGGFARAYQKVTGIAGYTLIYNSYGLNLVSHEPFESTLTAIEEEMDIHSSEVVLEYNRARITVADTDDGIKIKQSVQDLMDLLEAYETGKVKENY